ncbi:MAG: copper chaperone PCu(A)C [Anaerolineae bacterium]|nr:copper chaperone PCu(A)C [Anaerolineae bacterium]
MKREKIYVLLLVIIMVLSLTACSSGAEGPDLKVTKAWGRPSAMMKGNGAVYMLIENKGSQDDQLVGASSNVADAVEVHETSMADGVMKMKHIMGIDLPAGETVELKSGGYHIMLIGINEKFEVGSTITVTLSFEKSDDITLEVEIREE